MFKKKPIYIIGIILFTLILIANLVPYFVIPTAFGRGDMGGFGGGRPGGGFRSENSGFDTLEGADDSGSSGFESFGGGDFQDKGDFGGMRPDGENGDFTMPEGMEIPEGMTPPEGMEMPEDFDPSSIPGRGKIGDAMTLVTTIRGAFWLVLIVCILGDGLCIFMLIRISRQRKAAAMQTKVDSDTSAEQPPATGEDG